MKAIIIGAGIGGLATALALRKAGIDTEIYERTAAIHEVGAGISLWSNAIRALTHLGLGPALQSRSVAYTRTAILRSNGKPITDSSFAQVAQRLGPVVVVLHRADLVSLLSQPVQDAIRLNHLCTGFEQQSNSVVARFSNGAEARGDILIGADGIRSSIRAQLHPNEPIRYSGYTAWRSITRFDTTGLTESWGAGRRFGVVPMASGQVYWFATRNAPEGGTDLPGRSKQTLLELFGRFHPPIPALIDATEESTILRNDIVDREPLTAWGAGRVTLLGDAAHPMTPNLGQGGCQAIEDALVLARTLSKHSAPPDAFRAYETQRIARTTPIVLRSRQIGAVGQAERPVACRIRDFIFSLMPASLTVRQLEDLISFDTQAEPLA
jgi:2-polyprenyl-6-methoxyphenol hydroxylase-like FAD-dependent oxidoreductase